MVSLGRRELHVTLVERNGVTWCVVYTQWRCEDPEMGGAWWDAQ